MNGLCGSSSWVRARVGPIDLTAETGWIRRGPATTFLSQSVGIQVNSQTESERIGITSTGWVPIRAASPVIPDTDEMTRVEFTAQQRLLRVGFALLGAVQIALIALAVRGGALGIGSAVGIAGGTVLVAITVALISRARLRALGERRAIEVIGKAVEASLDADWLYEAIAEEARGIVRYDRFVVFAGSGEEPERIIYERNLFDDTQKESPKLRSGISAPMNSGGDTVGRLVIFSLSDDAYTSGDLDLLQRIAEEVAPAISDARQMNLTRRSTEDKARIEQLETEIEKLREVQLELAATNEDLEWRTNQVQDSRARLIDAQESAKRAMAEELHGGVQTRLYANWIKLQEIQERLGGRDAEELGTVIIDLDEIREKDIRLLSHRLHPSVIRLGIGPGLRSLREHYEGAVPIDLQISENIDALEMGGVSKIPENVRLGVYRIAEMALGNVVKHGRAKRCSVTLMLEEGNDLHLTVTDDGVGFPPDARVPSGLGIAMMNDYADSLGGLLAITSLPGQGTKIEVKITLNNWWYKAQNPENAAIGTLVNMHWAPPGEAPPRIPDKRGVTAEWR